MRVKFPAWITTVIAVLAVGLTLVADRVGLASQIGREDARIEAVEVQHRDMAVRMESFTKDIMQALFDIEKRNAENAVQLQRIVDRQDEIWRTLRIDHNGG